MSLGAVLFLMEHRTEAEFRFKATEHRFQIGQHGIGAPRRFRVPGGFVGARTTDPGMGQHGPLDRRLRPGDGSGLLSGLIRGDNDFVVPADAVAFLFQPSNALLDIRQLLPCAGFVQVGGEFFEVGLKAGHEARGDRGLLGLTPAGMAIQPDFRAIPTQNPL